MSERLGTHWDTCWQSVTHHGCTLVRIATLERERDDLKAQVATAAARGASVAAAGHERYLPCPDHRDKVDYRQASDGHSGCPQCQIERLKAQLAERTRERDDLINEKKARSKIDPTTRLHNLCDALAESRGESPYDQESWDLVDADNKALRARAESAEQRERELREALAELLAADYAIKGDIVSDDYYAMALRWSRAKDAARAALAPAQQEKGERT